MPFSPRKKEETHSNKRRRTARRAASAHIARGHVLHTARRACASSVKGALIKHRLSLRTLLGLVKDLRYKLRMLGVPLAGPAIVFGDNKSVVNGASIPEAKLSKKHLGICYHAIREASAAGIWKVGFTKGADNIANCLTKILSGTQKEKEVSQWMYRNNE